MRHEGTEDIATVTLTVPQSSRALALFQHVSIKRSAGGEPMLPILWSENDVTLWPGESLTLTAHFARQGAATPVVPAGDSLASRSVVEVSGWNVPTRSFPVVVESRTP
jgi:exo-1,4-beta-D-glucosaminidase